VARRSGDEDELVEVGTFERPHGVHGEIAFYDGEGARAPFPYRELLLPSPGAEPRVLVVAATRMKMDRWLLTLEGISSREEARALTGLRACVRYDSLPPPPGGTIYIHDLLGMELVDARSGERVGEVQEVRRLAGKDYLELAGEVLVPLAPELVERIDADHRRIVMALPDGLFDLGPGSHRAT